MYPYICQALTFLPCSRVLRVHASFPFKFILDYTASPDIPYAGLAQAIAPLLAGAAPPPVSPKYIAATLRIHLNPTRITMQACSMLHLRRSSPCSSMRSQSNASFRLFSQWCLPCRSHALALTAAQQDDSRPQYNQHIVE
eukprot:6181823-Pleurochrysis_carterae.AAC.1